MPLWFVILLDIAVIWFFFGNNIVFVKFRLSYSVNFFKTIFKFCYFYGSHYFGRRHPDRAGI